MSFTSRHLALILSFSMVSGCSLGPGMKFDPSPHRETGTPVAADEASDAYTLTQITPALLTAMRAASSGAVAANETAPDVSRYEYRVGPQDVLTIVVWDHPELTIPSGELFRNVQDAGILVDRDGTLFFPYVGVVQVGGKTVGEIREILTQRIARYITNPQISVRVGTFRSQRASVLGEVLRPSVLPINDVPLTALEAINQAGGAAPEADLSHVTLTRGAEVRTLNLQALYENAALSQNLVLQHGDVLRVPDRTGNKVYVLGEVGRQSSLLMRNGKMNLAEAIGGSEGFDRGSSDPSRVYVVRGDEQSKAVVYQLDAESPGALLLATQFQLNPQDVIYVSSTKLTRWNRVMSQILPTIQGLWQTRVLVND